MPGDSTVLVLTGWTGHQRSGDGRGCFASHCSRLGRDILSLCRATLRSSVWYGADPVDPCSVGASSFAFVKDARGRCGGWEKTLQKDLHKWLCSLGLGGPLDEGAGEDRIAHAFVISMKEFQQSSAMARPRSPDFARC
jgi:hypothetical protein